MSTITAQVHQSKWGFHPCSKELSKKLRTINRVYYTALHMQAAWDRWNNKDPQNRIKHSAVKDETGRKVGRMPVLDAKGKPVSMLEPPRCTLPAGGLIFEWTYKWPGKGMRPIRISGIGEDMLEASRQARKPQAKPEDVKPLKYSEQQIERLYAQCVEFESNRK